jgi:hypothetical protein
MLHLLSRVPYFGAVLPNEADIVSYENDLRKSCSALAPKMLVKLTPRTWPRAEFISYYDLD